MNRAIRDLAFAAALRCLYALNQLKHRAGRFLGESLEVGADDAVNSSRVESDLEAVRVRVGRQTRRIRVCRVSDRF